MGLFFAVLAVIALCFCIFYLDLVLFDHAIRKSRPLLQQDAAAFTLLWERRYCRMRRKEKKNAALVMISIGLYAQGKPDSSMDRMRFFRWNEKEAVYALACAHYHRLLLALGKEREAEQFEKEKTAALEKGKLSSWY